MHLALQKLSNSYSATKEGLYSFYDQLDDLNYSDCAKTSSSESSYDYVDHLFQLEMRKVRNLFQINKNLTPTMRDPQSSATE